MELKRYARDKHRKCNEGVMDKHRRVGDMYGRMIKGIAKADGISLTELSEKIGISRQALYKRLDGGMKVESFIECLRALGYEVYYGKDGKVRKIE